MVAVVVGELLQVPPGVPSVSVMVDATQTCDGPLIEAGSGFTVIVLERVQPVPNAVQIMVTVPTETPVTIPLLLPTTAIADELLLHVTPGVVVVRVMEEPTHTDDGPPISAGSGSTVTIAVVEQPAPME